MIRHNLNGIGEKWDYEFTKVSAGTHTKQIK